MALESFEGSKSLKQRPGGVLNNNKDIHGPELFLSVMFGFFAVIKNSSLNKILLCFACLFWNNIVFVWFCFFLSVY